MTSTSSPVALLASGLIATTALAGSVPAPEEPVRPATEEWRIEPWEGKQDLAAGGTFTVRNAHGDVNARRSERPRAEVYGVMQRHVEDPRRAEIDLRSVEGSVVAEVVQSAGEVGEEPTPWAFRRVDLTVYVPEGAPWRVATGAGRIDARRLRSDVEASTDSGDIVLILGGGSVNAVTRSGSVKVALGEVAWTGERRIESESGELSVSVPQDVDLDLEIETEGEVELDGAPATTGPIRIRLGKGGRSLTLRSATGRISFRSLG